MTFKTSETIVSTDIDTGDTVVFQYPVGMSAGMFSAHGHKLWVDRFQRLLASPADFTVAFGGSNITLTYLGATTIPEGARLNAQFNIEGTDKNEAPGTIHPDTKRVVANGLIEILLGAPITADPNGFVETQNLTSAGVFSVDGTVAAALTAAALKGVTDVPRNVVAAWTGTAVLTITGLDEYGKVVKESSASGTSFAGKKAFAKITDIQVSANVTGLTVGTGDVLGLPVFLPSTALVLKELQDGAAAAAGTVVAGVSTKATATTGDVRGTYDPNAAADGSKVFKLLVATGEPNYLGVDQFAG